MMQILNVVGISLSAAVLFGGLAFGNPSYFTQGVIGLIFIALNITDTKDSRIIEYEKEKQSRGSDEK